MTSFEKHAEPQAKKKLKKNPPFFLLALFKGEKLVSSQQVWGKKQPPIPFIQPKKKRQKNGEEEQPTNTSGRLPSKGKKQIIGIFHPSLFVFFIFASPSSRPIDDWYLKRTNASIIVEADAMDL